MSLEDRDYELAGLAVTDPERLSDAELGRLYHRVRVVFRRYENDYFQYRTGNFDSTTWAGYARSILDDAFGNPVVRAMWKLQRDNFDERFTDFMDDALAKSLARGGLPSTAKARFLEAMRESTAHPAQRE